MKLTKRKSFNFFRSYYDVFNELPEKDKLPFIEALLDRQFLGVKPEGLKGLANFAWISQVNSIDSQIKGYEDKTGVKLTPCQGGAVGGSDTPSLQVQEKEKEKEKEQYTNARDLKKESEARFEMWWDGYGKKVDSKKCKEKFTKLSIEDQEKAIEVVAAYVRSTPEKQYRKNPVTYINGHCWNDEIQNNQLPQPKIVGYTARNVV